MAERTDGPHNSTGKGLKPIALAAGVATESKVQAAYRAYLDHRPGCDDCKAPGTFQCPAAAALWQAYRDARG